MRLSFYNFEQIFLTVGNEVWKYDYIYIYGST